jgi:hypothetical protein
MEKFCIKCGVKDQDKLIPIEEGIFIDSYLCQPCANCVAGVSLDGSWYKVTTWAASAGQVNVLMVAPANADGSVEEDAWGPVEEHGFDCMGIRGEHDHDSEGVRWIAEINKAFNTEFTLEEFE